MDINLTRLSMHAPKLEWKAHPDAEAPEGCMVYTGQYKDRFMTLALPKEVTEQWDEDTIKRLKADVHRLITISKVSKNINWG